VGLLVAEPRGRKICKLLQDGHSARSAKARNDHAKYITLSGLRLSQPKSVEVPNGTQVSTDRIRNRRSTSRQVF